MISAGKSEKIDEEQVSIDSLVHYLKKRGCQEIQFQDNHPNDPPDYWITISAEKYAAEVTSITLEPDNSYDGHCQNLEAKIQQISQSNNSLKGNYVLKVMGRPNIPKSRSWKNLLSKATDYLKQTKDLILDKGIYLLNDRDGYVTIQKLSDAGASVGLARVGTKWGGVQAQAEVTNLFQNAIDKKRVILENKGVIAKCLKVIIVLYDAYGFLSDHDALEAFQKVHDYEWIHSVYWVASSANRPNTLYPNQPGRKGVFLYTKNQEWKKG